MVRSMQNISAALLLAAMLCSCEVWDFLGGDLNMWNASINVSDRHPQVGEQIAVTADVRTKGSKDRDASLFMPGFLGTTYTFTATAGHFRSYGEFPHMTDELVDVGRETTSSRATVYWVAPDTPGKVVISVSSYDTGASVKVFVEEKKQETNRLLEPARNTLYLAWLFSRAALGLLGSAW